MTLNPGWFIERLGGGKPGIGGSAGASGGSPGTGGSAGATGGTGGTGGTGSTGGTGGTGSSDGSGPASGSGGSTSAGGKPGGGKGGKAGSGPSPDPGTAGTFGEGGARTQPAERASAEASPPGLGSAEASAGLGVAKEYRSKRSSGATRCSSSSSVAATKSSSLYQFHVGDEIIDFNRGRLNIGIDVTDDVQCQPPPEFIDPARVLFETNVDALNNISLFQVLQAIATNDGQNADPVLLYQQIYDSYATADQAILPDAVHCGDETTDGEPTLNGFPITCNRVERFHVDDLEGFFPISIVNRLDLAPLNGAHCGPAADHLRQ